jgi:hypothetical protein
VGRGATDGSDEDESKGWDTEEDVNRGAGLPEWENNAHPNRKDKTLDRAIQIRRLIFNGFIIRYSR